MILNRTKTHATPPTRPLLNNKAYKIFEDAGSETDLFVPGLEDHYENLAASFLEQWTNPSQGESAPVTTPEPSTSFPTFTTELDWQLAH